jgi:ribonuclease D
MYNIILMIVQTEQQLVDICHRLRGVPAIFLDTEFVSEGRYYPDLGSIQLAAGNVEALIDPLAIRDLSPLFSLLLDPNTLKVFHAPMQDAAILYRKIGHPVAPVFDTQVAAALLGIDEQISFANLVQHCTGVRLSKAHSFTDWLRRPLSPGQVEYALDDVRYLIPVYEQMVRELDKEQRIEWATEEFQQRFEDETRLAPADPRELYLKLRGIDRMPMKALTLLRELVAWREEIARARNLPVGRVARDEVLIELARRPRTSLIELREVRALQPQQIEQFGKDLLQVLARGPVDDCPVVKHSSSLPPSLEPTVDFLCLCLRSLAGVHAVSPGMVATRSDLAALIQAGEQADVPLMRGWRREVIGEDLLATLQGRATARIIPGSRQVHLDWNEPATE